MQCNLLNRPVNWRSPQRSYARGRVSAVYTLFAQYEIRIVGKIGRSRQVQRRLGAFRKEMRPLAISRRLCKAGQPAARFRSAIWREFLRQRLAARAPRLVEHVKKVKQQPARENGPLGVLEWWVGKGREQA